MTLNPSRQPVRLPHTADSELPARLLPASSGERDPGLNEPLMTGVADEAEPKATISGWPRVFPGL